ncbi:MAG: carboxypeptidase regulatory-like domain-containing protein [Armatimonadetes bacterium]|nr:carboxypeptidase regulatory-like domain-containing protein [Armatimonadota bacterium]
MKALHTLQRSLPFCLAIALLAALFGIGVAAPSPSGPNRPALSLPALTAKAAALHLADFEQDDSVAGAGDGFSRPHLQANAASTDPVQLQPYSGSEVVHITNAAGQTVRAPQSATDTSIAPNQPLTFTVTVNNVDPTTGQPAAATQATAVYIQIKDPDSAYQDINLSGSPREHKVFTKDYVDYSNNPTDDGSATFQLYNGQITTGSNIFLSEPLQTFMGDKIGTVKEIDRGAVGDQDATSYLTVGHVNAADQGTQNPVVVTDGTDVHNLPGIDTSASLNNRGGYGANSVETKFHATGQEYECQYLNAHDNGVSTAANPSGYTGGADAADSDYGVPYYLAGYDDQFAASSHPSRTEWLKLNPVAGNANQYSATWVSPTSPSDFYMDVIIYDNQNNWRIFDNVWGFSTLPFSTAHDILLVNDNALGQKFGASAPLRGGPVNLRPVFYGAESYFTDINTSLLPNAVETWLQAVGRTPTVNGAKFSDKYGTDQIPIELIQGLGFNYDFNKEGFFFSNTLGGSIYNFGGYPFVYNALGYFSYDDYISDREFVPPVPNINNPAVAATGSTTVTEPRSQAYSLWRILSRGRVPTSVYQAYEPQFLTQPAVNDPLTGFKAPAADGTSANAPMVVNATRCILWMSPFTGDQPLNVAGSLADSTVQSDLTAFVNAGGRLLVSGQEVASSLTFDGLVSNPFVANVLNATLKTTGSENTFTSQTLTGVSGLGHQLSFDSLINWQDPTLYDSPYSDFFEFTPIDRFTVTVPFAYKSPADTSPIYLGNNYAEVKGSEPQWRTDAALTQLGPVTTIIGNNSTIQGRINSVNAINGATADFSNGEGSALIYKSNYASAVGSGFGSRVVYASFGLEGVGSQFYRKHAGNQDFFYPRNTRRDIMHNAVSYLRTGTFVGRVFQGSGSQVGVAGATVYLLPFRGVSNNIVGGTVSLPGGRQTYSATTSDGTVKDVNGNTLPVGGYEINGVEPGMYQAFVYKTGFSHDQSPVKNVGSTQFNFSVYGDTTATVNLNIVPLPPSSISGKVTLNSSTGPGVPNATVTFSTSDTPPIVVTATTDANGNYTASVPAGAVYTGVATSTNPQGKSLPVTNIIPPATGVNFVITVNPGTITGRVTDGTNGIVGATVSFTPQGSTTATATATTGAGGVYTSPGLSDGVTYTITAGKTGFVATNSATATVHAGTQVNASNDIVLHAAVNVTLSGHVRDSASLAGIPNATVTIRDLNGNTVASPTTDSNGFYTVVIQQGTYTLTPSASGYQAATPVQVTLTVNATQDFTLTLAPAKFTFPGGHYNLISLPYDDPVATAFTDVFGPQRTQANPSGNRSLAAIYQDVVNGQVFQNYVFEPQAPADGIHIGRGYFVYLINDVTLRNIPGTPPSGATVTVPLQGGTGLDGWNMIGVPSTTPISVSRIQVQFPNGGLVSLADAVNINHAIGVASVNNVNAVLFGLNPLTNSYTPIPLSGQMQPYHGYWIRARLSGLSILIPTGGG